MSIQPATKAVEHMISSYKRKENRKEKVLEKRTEAVKAYLTKNSKGDGEEKRRRKKVTLTSSQKDWAEFYGCIK